MEIILIIFQSWLSINRHFNDSSLFSTQIFLALLLLGIPRLFVRENWAELLGVCLENHLRHFDNFQMPLHRMKNRIETRSGAFAVILSPKIKPFWEGVCDVYLRCVLYRYGCSNSRWSPGQFECSFSPIFIHSVWTQHNCLFVL